MHAVISHRTAAAVTIDGQTFEHQRWTLVDALTEGVEAATLPPVGQKQPELRVLEVDGPDDPRLGAVPVVGHEPEEADAVVPISPASPLPNLATLSDNGIKRLARSLNISGSQPRADLVAAIEAKHAEAEAQTEPIAPDEPVV